MMTPTLSIRNFERLKTNWTRWSSTRRRREAYRGIRMSLEESEGRWRGEDEIHLDEESMIHQKDEGGRKHQKGNDVNHRWESGDNHRFDETTTTDRVTTREGRERQRSDENDREVATKNRTGNRQKEKGRERHAKIVASRQWLEKIMQNSAILHRQSKSRNRRRENRRRRQVVELHHHHQCNSMIQTMNVGCENQKLLVSWRLRGRKLR